MRKVYSWNGVPNFGDKLTTFILGHLGVEHENVTPEGADMVMVGSILEHLPPRWAGTVFGSGKLRPSTRIDLTNANVVALRGRLTRNLADLDQETTPILGDPGLLVSEFVRQGPAKHDLGVIPHWSDTELAQRFPYGHVIDVSQEPGKVIAEIASCKRIISSSLHGLVVADAYGIPRQAELFAQAEREGGDFKFRDYASAFDGIGSDPHFGHMWRAPYAEVARIQKQLRRALADVANREVAEEIPAPTRPGRIIRWRRPQISLLVPFRDDGEHRTRVWRWLRRYWESQLDSCEIVMGHDGGWPFSKAAAVNDAASRARGRTLAILDADAYMDAGVLQHCATTLDRARRAGQRVWFMPYNHLYRLSREFTMDILDTDPRRPYRIGSPPSPGLLENDRNTATYGHKYGAMIQVMPREAFFETGGMDPRFRGWGAEDVSFLRALDTVWGHHEVLRHDVSHMWHERPGRDWQTRRWVGQADFGPANSRLAQRYAAASGEPIFMRGLAAEREQPKQRGRFR